MTQTSSHTDISQNATLLWLMAVACGVCAGVNYYSQPLIASLQIYFQVPESQVALTVTFAQVSYALGLLLIVPLGDILNKRRLIPILMNLTACGLLLCAFAVNLEMLWIGTIMAGLFSVAAQVLIPLAAMSTKPEKTGEVVGRLMTGLLVGILCSTSLAGLLSYLFHWNIIYICSAIVLILLSMILKPRLPTSMLHRHRYIQVLISMGSLLKQHPRLLYRSCIGAGVFASMSILFSTIALLMHSKFQLSDVLIGMITLVGVFGALSTQYVGKFADQGYTHLISWIGLALMLCSWGFLYTGQWILACYVIGFALINLGLACVHTSNQNVIFRLEPHAKSRINSIYMTSYFIGGASGSALGAAAYQYGGWIMSCYVGVALVAFAALCCVLDQRLADQQTSAS